MCLAESSPRTLEYGRVSIEGRSLANLILAGQLFFYANSHFFFMSCHFHFLFVWLIAGWAKLKLPKEGTQLSSEKQILKELQDLAAEKVLSIYLFMYQFIYYLFNNLFVI